MTTSTTTTDSRLRPRAGARLVFDGGTPDDDPGGTGGKPKPDEDLAKQLDAANAEVEKWKALSRKHEDRAKANADAADRLKALEDKDKSEVQKLTDRATAAEKAAEAARKEAEEARLEATRLTVATAKGLTPAQATRLRGTTEEELTKDAEDLLASFKPSTEEKPRKASTSKPRPTLRGGDDPEDEPDESDPIKLVADIPR